MSSELMLLEHIMIRRIMKRKRREKYIRNIFANRENHGQMFLFQELQNDPEYFQKYLRMDKSSFDIIFGKIKNKIAHPKNHRYPIDPELRLVLTLRYLATGASMSDLSFNFLISPSSITSIIREVLIALWTELMDEYLPEPSVQLWSKNAEDFEKKWNFKHAVGALDGKHVRVKNFAQAGSEYYNYKNYFSIVLLASVDACYKFNYISVGSSGTESDSGILRRSRFGNDLIEGTLELPASEELPYVFLGDQGFALLCNLMIPFAHQQLNTDEKKVFNYRLSRARRVVENAFGILAARWRIFRTEIDAKEDLVKLIIQVSCILHNFIMTRNDTTCDFTPDEEREGEIVPGSWRNEIANDTGMIDIQANPRNESTNAAKAIRIKFAEFFVSEEGEVPWQWEHVEKGYYA